MSLSNNFEKILVLAPHTDDVELGCGGSMVKFLEAGREIFWVVFSKSSVEPPFPLDAPLQELREAAAVLGVNLENLIILNYQVRHLPEFRQEILEHLIRIKEQVDPDLVLMPSLTDIHQDHSTVAQEGLRAFKHISILGYEDPWNHLHFNSSSFIHLEKRHIEKKIAALKRYESQAQRLYMDEKFIESLARTRGVQIGTQYAEAFEVVRWIMK